MKKIAVREHRALGMTGGAGSVEQRCEVGFGAEVFTENFVSAMPSVLN